MALRVLIVDDSRFFRRRIEEIISSDTHLEVVGTAENGAKAIELVTKLSPDVITMDVEMPVMDGITAVRRIMARKPTPILMFSSLTTEGAQSTFDALDAGALDYLPKRFEDISKNRDEAKRILCMRIRQLGAQRRRKAILKPLNLTGVSLSQPIVKKQETEIQKRDVVSRLSGASVNLKNYSVLAIGTSTGGPIALQELLTKLPRNFPLPILLVQHMPSTFTTAFAARLDRLCDISVKEAESGDLLKPGSALLAPGGFQMEFERRGGSAIARINETDDTYKPSVDVTFTSLARLFPGKVLAIILTGMGADGREGIRLLKKENSTCWAQNEESCVVFGMPGAVVDAGLADQVLPLSDIGIKLAQGV